jgi:CBS-domain-containing membrane protein
LPGACWICEAAQIMTTDSTSRNPSDCLLDVLSTMQARGLVRVPVVDAEHKPSGVLNARDAQPEPWILGQDEAPASRRRDGVGY